MISYAHGFYPFGKTGRYDTREDIIIKPSSDGKYILDNYSKIEKYVTIFKTNRRKIKNDKCTSLIDSSLVHGLIRSLKSDKYPIDHASLDTNLIKGISLRKIKKIARRDDLAWLFSKSYSDTTEINFFLNDIKNPVRLDSFFLNCQRREFQDIIVVDAYHYLQIKLYYDNDSVLYESDLLFNRFFGQPFIDRYKANKTSKIDGSNSVYNLDINKYLIAIVPNKSEIKNEFGLNSYLDSFIAWYIDLIDNDKIKK